MKGNKARKKRKKAKARARNAPVPNLVLGVPGMPDDTDEFKPDRIQDSLTDGMRWRLALRSLYDASTLAHLIATIQETAGTHTVELALTEREAVVRLVAKDAE